jgi:hypothetical protein
VRNCIQSLEKSAKRAKKNFIPKLNMGIKKRRIQIR